MNLNADLWRRARIKAAERDTTLTELVEHCLAEGMDVCSHYTDEIKADHHFREDHQHSVD